MQYTFQYAMAEIKIFISSVQTEFADERKRLCDYIRQDALLGRFFVPFIFEELPAINTSAQEATNIKKYINDLIDAKLLKIVNGENKNNKDVMYVKY